MEVYRGGDFVCVVDIGSNTKIGYIGCNNDVVRTTDYVFVQVVDIFFVRKYCINS